MTKKEPQPETLIEAVNGMFRENMAMLSKIKPLLENLQPEQAPSQMPLNSWFLLDYNMLAYNKERELHIAPVNICINTRVPSKWRFVDLETGDVWQWSEVKGFTQVNNV